LTRASFEVVPHPYFNKGPPVVGFFFSPASLPPHTNGLETPFIPTAAGLNGATPFFPPSVGLRYFPEQLTPLDTDLCPFVGQRRTDSFPRIYDSAPVRTPLSALFTGILHVVLCFDLRLPFSLLYRTFHHFTFSLLPVPK